MHKFEALEKHEQSPLEKDMLPTPRIVYTLPISIEFSLTTIVAKGILHFALKT
jgi:hypothetical protein